MATSAIKADIFTWSGTDKNGRESSKATKSVNDR